MGELLQSILSLREDINKLTEFSNEAVYEYCELAIKFADDKEDILILSSEKKYIENCIKDFKYKKSLLFSLPIGILYFVSYFIYHLMYNWPSLAFGSSFVKILSFATIGMTLSGLSTYLLIRYDKFNNFLVKKYPNFKYMNEIIININNEIKNKEEELTNIEKRKQNIINTISNNEEILENKREELSKLEIEYFNNIKNNPVTKGTTYKKRTRTIGNTNLKLYN